MNQLMNFLQAASNTAASNVSGPVDLIAEALRAAGVPVPRNALLSSEWMRERGLTAPVQQGASQVAGDTLGLLAPVAAAAKAPQIARGLLSLDDKAMDMTRRGVERYMGDAGLMPNVTVYHGSKDPTWIDRGEAFSGAMPDNMPSKFMWVNPKKAVAENYAGISEMQLWKAANGLGPAPAPTAGVRKLDLDDAANVLRVKDVKKAAQNLGVEWGGPTPLEDLLDAAKRQGFDAVRMEMDGGNIAVLNPAKLTTKKARAAKAAP